VSGIWTIIRVEGHCLREYDITGKTSKYLYRTDGSKVDNPDYDPTYVPPPIPSWCPRVPKYVCLEKGCIHFVCCVYRR